MRFVDRSDQLFYERVIASRLSRLVLCLILLMSAADPVATAQTRAGEPDREQWQRLADLFTAMAIGTGDAVADVGAGDGFVSIRLSRLVGSTGKVLAVDVAEPPLERLRKRVEEAGASNVTVIKGDDDDPHLPPSALDAVIILNSYHEMASYEDMLRHIHESLKSGGRLVIAEPYPLVTGQSRTEQIKVHRISPELVAAEVTGAGFVIIDRQDDFTKIPIGGGGYSLIVARRR